MNLISVAFIQHWRFLVRLVKARLRLLLELGRLLKIRLAPWGGFWYSNGVLNLNEYIGETTSYDKKLMLERKDPTSWLESVSAFANTQGGKLLFGGHWEIVT